MNGFDKRTEKKRQQIKEATFTLLKTKIAKAITIKEIAQLAQVSQVTIYNYFESKELLIREVMKEYIAKQVQQSKDLFQRELPLKVKIEMILFQKKATIQDIEPANFQQLLTDDHELQQFVESLYQNDIMPLFIEMIQQAQARNEINPNLSIQAILFYLDTWKEASDKLTYDDFSHDDLAQFTEELIQLFFYGLSPHSMPNDEN
ncbi:TetR/AcrR family transcriptional regulator [Bacillus sp. REN10]|uniref:TetR/AcrR family transcriptional regulator n=1 Tax=Bacillus sp. REN10 TaxID=2782541 RepID=UPI00193C5185|nr:TetR/AcrR family transcriptional regulator [Bacillus sp. REN10]